MNTQQALRSRSSRRLALAVRMRRTGCSDRAVEGRSTGPRRSRRMVGASSSAGAQTPPSSAPAAYQHYTWIDVTADVGWLDAHTAYGTVGRSVRSQQRDGRHQSHCAQRVGCGHRLQHGARRRVVGLPGRSHAAASARPSTSRRPAVASPRPAASGTAFDTWLSTSQNIAEVGRSRRERHQDRRASSLPSAAHLPGHAGDQLRRSAALHVPAAAALRKRPDPSLGHRLPGPELSPPYTRPAQSDTGSASSGTRTRPTRRGPAPGSRPATGTTTGDRGPCRSLASRHRVTPARTQSSADLPSVFVIVSDQVPSDAIAVIERHKTGPLKNVLLVPSSTIRPAVFVAAMQALYDSRDKDGDAPAKDLVHHAPRLDPRPADPVRRPRLRRRASPRRSRRRRRATPPATATCRSWSSSSARGSDHRLHRLSEHG